MALGLNWGKRRWRREGDRRRDAKEWGPAAAAYRRHLARNPADAAIWVQLGHAEKEGGNLPAAEAAYRRAAELTPEDADVHLQLGHILKVQDRFDDAFQAYRRSHHIKPGADTAVEIGRLRPRTGKQTVRVLGEGTIFFSIQDLFGYLHAHPTMSGIQRVQAGIALNAMSDETINARFILNTGIDDETPGSFFMLDNDQLAAIIAYASGDWVDHAKLRLMLADAELTAERVRPARGATVILLGAFWGHGNTIDQYVVAKTDGVRIGAYVYDIIPVTHPEYCDAALARDFSMSLGELCLIVDFILTISDHTGLALRQFLAANGGRDIPMATVPLAHSLTVQPTGVESWPALLGRVKGRRYAAYVSTIEGRKNHIFVVNVWRQLIAEGVDVPDLVFVGRKGWRVNGLMDLLEGTSYLDGRVHIVHGLTDAELNAVYAGAMFTVFTSFVEGWGLPVGESLMHHVPCIASSTSSIPEVGGDFVDYVDPYNLSGALPVFRRMIGNAAYRAERVRTIREYFVPRSWQAVGRNFVEKVKQFEGRDYPAGFARPLLPEGVIFRPADLVTDVDAGAYLASPTRLLLSGSFYGMEGHGAWMRGRIGEVTFQTGLAAGEEIIVYLEGHPAPNHADRAFTMEIKDAAAPLALRQRWHPLWGHGRNLIRSKGRVAADGTVTILIQFQGEVDHGEVDTRPLGFGLRALAWARASSVALREDIIEEFTFREVG